jgi:hypothetical protein
MKHRLQIFLALFFWACLSGKAQENQSERQILRTNSTYLGMEYLITHPQTKNGFAMTHHMYGLNVEFMGVMTIANLTGFAYIRDSNAHSKAKIQYIDFHGSFPIFKWRAFNFRPEVGFRMTRTSLNYFFKDHDWDANGLGAGMSAGLAVNVGPTSVKLKYSADGLINLGRNSMNGLTHYASVTVGFSPMNLFMNPKNFTFTGLARHISDYKKVKTGESVSYSSNYKTTTTTYQTTWKENYGLQNFSCKDVQPYWWLGPRVLTNFSTFRKDQIVASLGANLGFRYGSLFANAFYEQGEIPFKEPFKRKYDYQSLYQARLGRMDGSFVNSSRYGFQLGMELVTWLQKKDFVYQYSRLQSVTSHFSIIPFVAYGKANLGDIRFYDENGLENLEDYLEGNGSTNSTDIRKVPKNLDYYGLGFQVGFGAIAFNVEKSWFRGSGSFYPLTSTWLVSMNYNIPVARVVRALGSKRKFRKAMEESQKSDNP